MKIGYNWIRQSSQQRIIGAHRVVAAGKDEHTFELVAEGILDWVGRGFHNPLQRLFCSGDSFGRGPGALPLISPAGPFALNR